MLDIRTFSPADKRFLDIVSRNENIDATVGPIVAHILDDIRTRGGDALLQHVQQHDAPMPNLASLVVTRDEIDRAANSVEPEFLEAVKLAADNIRDFHRRQLRGSYTHDAGDGATLEKIVLPIFRVGVYCPAGTAPLFSSLLMNAVPAQIAGVAQIAVAIPPRKDGSISPHMLAAANHLGLGEIYKMGGAQAIAALAYGAGPVTKVDKIVGPGNAFVAAAKRAVFGIVGIDAIAGPSEVVIIADASANPTFVAADLLSQVEHGSGYESGVILTDNRDFAERAAAETARLAATLERSDAIRKALANYGGIFVCDSLDAAVDAANVIAPEHLEIQTAEPRRLLARVVNAGAVFLGPWSSEPVGDYFAGTNHVLPTNGAARFASSLGVADFLKDISVIDYSREKLGKVGRHITLMAEKEQLTAHAKAIQVRLDAIRDGTGS